MRTIGGINPHSADGHFYAEGSSELWDSLQLFSNALQALVDSGYKLVRQPDEPIRGILPDPLPDRYPTRDGLPIPCGFVNPVQCVFYCSKSDNPVLGAEWDNVYKILSAAYGVQDA